MFGTNRLKREVASLETKLRSLETERAAERLPWESERTTINETLEPGHRRLDYCKGLFENELAFSESML